MHRFLPVVAFAALAFCGCQSSTHSKTWSAICTKEHRIWMGDDFPTQSEAEEDARGHDRRVHGGLRTATVGENP